MSGYKDTNISTHFKTFLNCRITHLDVLSSKSFLCTWGSKNSSPLVTRHSSGFRDKNESDKGGVLPCWTCEVHFIRYLLTKEVTTNSYWSLVRSPPSWRNDNKQAGHDNLPLSHHPLQLTHVWHRHHFSLTFPWWKFNFPYHTNTRCKISSSF